MASRYKVESAASTLSSVPSRNTGSRQQNVAEKIEIQTRYAAELYNVDVQRVYV